MPPIIGQDLIELLRQLLGGLPEKIWHSFTTTDVFPHNIQVATSLTAGEWETLLLASGIMFKKGHTTMFSKQHVEHLKNALQENLILHIALSQLKGIGKQLFFISVGKPLFRNPIEQSKKNPRVLPNRRGNGLNEAHLRLLARLCAERASTEEPELIVEEQLPLLPQEQDNLLPQAEETQQPRPAHRRRVYRSYSCRHHRIAELEQGDKETNRNKKKPINQGHIATQ